MVIGLAVVAGAVPASFAQDTPAPDYGKPAGAEEPQAHEDMSDGSRSKTWEHMGAFVAEPVGRFRVGPEFVDGETVYILRTPVSQGVTTVEVSTTPFEPSGVGELTGNPDEHPAGW
jgi:hypothetical protein